MMRGQRGAGLTRTISFRSFALYAARALARANCVCLGVRIWATSGRKGSTDEKQIILNQIALERLDRQAPVAHGQNKWVPHIAIPDPGDVGSLEKILDEAVAGETKRLGQHGRQAGEAREGLSWDPYGAKGSLYVEWKWFNGPLPCPRSGAVRMPASMYLHAALQAFGISSPLASWHAIAAGGIPFSP